MATVDTLIHDKLIERAATVGNRILDGLKDQLQSANYITDIRGKGLMIGIELNEPCSELVMLAKAKGLLINVTADSVIRLLPPLTLSDEEADLAVDSIAKLIKVYAGDDRQSQRRAKNRDSSDRRNSNTDDS